MTLQSRPAVPSMIRTTDSMSWLPACFVLALCALLHTRGAHGTTLTKSEPSW